MKLVLILPQAIRQVSTPQEKDDSITMRNFIFCSVSNSGEMGKTGGKISYTKEIPFQSYLKYTILA